MQYFKKIKEVPKTLLKGIERPSKTKNNRPTDGFHRPGSDLQPGADDKASASSGSLASKESFNPWLEAQQLLTRDKTLNKIWEKSIHILKSDFGFKLDDKGNTSRVNDLRIFLNAITQRLDDKKWTVLDDIGQSNTREKLTKVCRNILLVKDLINPTAAMSPPAAIACAGITVGLLLFIQAMEQHEILLQGLETISSLIPRLHIIEHHFLQRDTDLSADLRRMLERDVILLYSKILEFQSRSICYLQKQTATQFLMDMLKQDAWDGILQDIERYDTSIRNATSSVHVVEVDRKFEAIQDVLQQLQVWQTTSALDQRRASLFKRLYTCPYKDRKERNNKRVPGTCEWFTKHPQFTKWSQSQKSELLWVSADPGCGKSVLTRYLADEYLPSGVRTVCYFFFKDDYPDQKRATNALASILRQLLIVQPHLVNDSLLDKFETAGDQLVESFSEMWNMLVEVTADENAGEVVCLFDALDECHEDDRKRLIQAVESLYLGHIGNRKLKFLMTSRPYDHIRREFFRLEDSLPTIHLSGENEENIEMISHEINLVIEERVRDIGQRNSLEAGECQFISDQLTSVSNRTYLWVSLALDVVERMPGFSRGNVRRVIQEIPEDVDAAYTRILDRSSDHLKARRLLHIVTAAERPLTLREISLALAFSAKDQPVREIQDEIQTDDKRIQRMIRSLCGLFLVVIDGKVYLLHQTAKEFLVRESCNSACDSTEARTWKHSLHPEESHYILAGICTLYLSQDTTQEPFPGFMDYAASSWATHFRRASVSSEDIIAKRGHTLCQTETKIFEAWAAIFKRNRRRVPDSCAILMASYLGLTAVIKILLETGKVDVESKDSEYGQTPLLWAAGNGHEGVVKLLLETGKVDIESKSTSGRTPLSWAAGNGHERVVKLLLETREVDIETKDSVYGRTPLSLAAENGHEGVVKLLLETGKVDIETKDSIYGRTSLSWAAWNGHEGVVKLLLETGKVDVESKDSIYGRTPLSWAAWNGHEGVVKLLLETGKVEIESKSQSGRTPLSWAAEYGHEGVVKLLLETGKVDVETKDSIYGRTPLSLAAANGHEGVVKLLLETGKVEIESKSQSGRTPLSWAAEYGHERVVKLLLETREVDIETKDSVYGRTSLSLAAANGHEGVVKLLLKTGKVDIETKDSIYGRTPLSWAAWNGHEGVVKLLLETGKVDVESKDSIYGRTPLSWAAWNGHEGVVKLLLETGKADIEYKSPSGRTPLSWAAENGHEGVVKLLLETGKVDVESKDSEYGQTPLSRAAENGHEGVVKLLLETGKVDVESKSQSGQTPLSWAAWDGHEGVVKLLLETGKVDIESKSRSGRTPLSCAAENGHEGVVKLLLETGKVDIESKDTVYGLTPLSWAAENGHAGVVKMFHEATVEGGLFKRHSQGSRSIGADGM